MRRSVFNRAMMSAGIAAAIWGTAISTAPVGMADPPDLNCTQVNNEGGCVYKNCTDAKAHGRCNIPRGDQAYCPSQDRDGDGLACEC
ncbi:excalibur calcium-binding domain-containing protein [Mycobacterium nebraskense]|nr:excalibur calcium-binding domain-containing protein [Mycobacterium nebraskense]